MCLFFFLLIHKMDKMEPEKKRCKLEPKPLRKFKKIPIFIVDYHNDVLEFIYRCFGSRHLPLTDNTLVHFDSHPDMVISKGIPASCVENKDFLLNELSIENWIMPTLYAGQFNHLVWLKNSWCQQIPVGKYDFRIGEHDDLMYVDLPVDYFASEGNYSEEQHLERPKSIKLEVYNVDDYVEDLQLDKYVLDIDLDFFSTKNPFLEVYKKANCYEQLKTIFNYDRTKMSLEASQKRCRQLDNLKAAFEYIDEHKSLDSYENNEIPPETFEALKELVASMAEHYTPDEVEWSLVFDAGCTADNDGLPHHISTDDELIEHYRRFKEFLISLPCPPVIVTISRSSEDDYCPVNQVTVIQSKVIETLVDVFEDKIHSKAIMHYLNEEWDVMEL